MSVGENIRLGSWLSVIVCLVLGACKKDQDAKPTEAPDEWENLAKFDPSLPMEQSWDQVKTRMSGTAAVKPWSDSYWPYVERGMAGRWMSRHLRNNQYIFTPYEQFVEYTEAAEARDPVRLAELSPAEKYDFIMTWADGVRPSASALQALRQATSGVQAPDIKPDTPVDRARQEVGFARARVNGAIQAGREAGMVNALVIDYFNAVRALGELIHLVPGDSGEMSVPELVTAERQQLAAAIRQPLEGLASAAPLFVQGWSGWAKYASEYGDKGNWKWFGHCDGWAAAAIREQPPKHSVLVRRKGYEVLFTEGDVRALLTKLYADQPPPSLQPIGMLCNAAPEDVSVSDGTYRILDGVYCDSSTALNQRVCKADSVLNGEGIRIESLRFEKLIDPRNPNRTVWAQKLHFRRGPARRIHAWATLISTGQGANNYAMTFPSESAWRNDYGTNRTRFLAGQTAFQNYNSLISLTKACRGVNPASFHLALAEIVGKSRQSFVVDVDRFGEVWNHPVYKYEAKVVPYTNEKGISFPEVIPIDRINDRFADFRAHGTKFLVQIETELWYAYQNGPLPAYGADDDLVVSIKLYYTLELDANRRIIGGEWSHLTWYYTPQNTPDDAAPLPESRPPAPDLAWRYDPADTTFASGLLNPAIVRRIVQCSQTGNPSGTSEVAGQEVRYSVCDL